MIYGITYIPVQFVRYVLFYIRPDLISIMISGIVLSIIGLFTLNLHVKVSAVLVLRILLINEYKVSLATSMKLEFC